MINVQMQTLSARVPSEDLQWLSALEIGGAVTPSDKLRALIAQMRKQHEGALDYTACTAWLRDLLGPFIARIRGMEHRERMHSAAIGVVAEWAPQIMATLLSEHQFEKDAAESARALEESVVRQCFQLLAALLRLGVTPDADCYRADVIETQLPRVLELVHVISTNRESTKEKRS